MGGGRIQPEFRLSEVCLPWSSQGWRHRPTGQVLDIRRGRPVVGFAGPAATIGLVAVTTISLCVPAANASGPYQPRTFYVARWGSDLNAGTNPHRPWRSVYHVNKAMLRPGDRVLFRGGETFSDATLLPGAAGTWVTGTAAAPVTFSSYGRGLPRLQKGIFFAPTQRLPSGPSYLTFRNLVLNLQPTRGTYKLGER